MKPAFDREEVRVMGALIEKEITTPDNYPLSLNSLTNACNQKSNRDPVVKFDETTVTKALERLRSKGLSRRVTGADLRVPKYYHTFDKKFGLQRRQLTVLCVLMLRGAQTVGELRSRSSRLFDFDNLEEVESVLNELSSRVNDPLVIKLPRQPGTKEARYLHLLTREESNDNTSLSDDEKIISGHSFDDLERKLDALANELECLRHEFSKIKNRFSY